MSNNHRLSIPEEIYNYDDRDVALPSFYERACVAVKECSEIPEANEWKGKAEAIIAYSKTVDDKRLENYAKRIKARAYRRMGELLKQYDASGQNAKKQKDVEVLSNGRVMQSEQLGISEKQRKTAIRLERIPEQQFTEQIDREKPATITELAAQGTRKYMSSEKPKGYADALFMKGDIKSLTERMDKHDPLYIMGGLEPKEVEEMKNYISIIEAWCDTFIINIE